MFPNEEVFSSALVHGGRRLRGVFFALRRRPPLGDSMIFLLFGGSPPRSRFLEMGMFVPFFPPLRPPRIGTSVRMVHAIAGWVDGERKDITTARWTRWRTHGRRRLRRRRIRNRWRCRRRGFAHGIGFCRRRVPVVPRIDLRRNGGVTRSERFHCAKAFSRVAVGHFKMIRHISLRHLRLLLVALNHRVKVSQRTQDLDHLVPVGLTDASGRGYRLRELLLRSL